MSEAARAKLVSAMTGVRSLELHNPRVAHDPALREWWGRARRLLTSPKEAVTQVDVGARLDVEAVLSTVRVPTLVLQRRDDAMFDVETSRLAASLIPDARFVELPGSESDLFLGDPPLSSLRSAGSSPNPATSPPRRIDRWQRCCLPTWWPRPNNSQQLGTTPGDGFSTVTRRSWTALLH